MTIFRTLLLSGFMLLVVMTGASVFASEENVNDIRFPLGKWSPRLIAIVESGPSILSDDTTFDVPAPPANDSDTTKEELAWLAEIAKTERSEYAVERILFENGGRRAHQMFLEEGLIKAENYKALILFEIIDLDHAYFILERKKHFARPRPSQLSKEFELIIPNPAHAAYPSGHASQTWIVALVLSDFDPDNADVYKKWAIDIAHRREIAGVHYPSDSEAGRNFAVDVLEALRKVPAFEKKYQAAKESYVKPSAEVLAAKREKK
ncbi:MAG: phosphatase PAP2 family protein [Alphaproteobacteria bacterium]